MGGNFAHGTVLNLGVVVAELTKIGGPKMKTDEIDVTSHDSPGKFKEFVAGLRDGGEVALEGNLIDAAQANVLVALHASGTVVLDAKIICPNAEHTTWTFDCFVKGFEGDQPHDGKMAFSATLKVTGQPTLAAATT